MLGAKVFSNGKEELNFTLEPKKSVTFRHRVLVRSGKMQPITVEPQYQEFIKGTSLP